MSTSTVLDRLQAVESRTDAVLRPMVDAASAASDPHGLEARCALVATLAAAVGAGPVPEAALDSSAAAGSDPLVAAALVEVMPTTVEWMIGRGVSESDAWRSMADVPRKIATYGLRGTGADWLAAVATGSVVTVGRLQFERPGQAPGRPDGEQGWGVHIPELGPLDPDACDAAFTAAPAVLEQLWGVRARWWTCDSWLLDPRLTDVLGPRANLVRFADRFTLVPPAAASHGSASTDGSANTDGSASADGSASTDGDASIAKFVFGTSVSDMRTAEPVGRLQAGLRAILDTGEHWSERVGTAPVRS